MQRLSPVSSLVALLTIAGLAVLAGCGGSSSSSNSTVTQIVLSATTVSLNEGDVQAFVGTPENSAGTPVLADVTYTSSNPSIATVATGGSICAGQWDASFIVCTPTLGQAGVGQVTITATANHVSSTATVYVHLKLDRVVVNPPPTCTSMGAAVVATASAFSTSAPGCSPTAPCDITSTVGPFSFGSNDPTVAALNTSGVLTAVNPGTTGIYASVSNVHSVSVPYVTCAVNSIFVHLSSSSATNVQFNSIGGTLPITADVFDTAGAPITPTLSFASSQPAVVSGTNGASGNIATLTAFAPGTASVTAACGYPSCNIGLPPTYSTNVLTANVVGTTTTTVFAASTSSTMLVPIGTANNTGGTPITLPFVPNSLVPAPNGTVLYLGSANGLMAVNLTTNTVTTFGIAGTVVAVSPDGGFAFISDNTGNVVYSYNLTTGGIAYVLAGKTNFSVYTPDSRWNQWITGNALVYGLPILGQSVLPLIYTPNDLDVIAQGGLTYITSSSSRVIDVRATCNEADVQNVAATAPTLIKAIPNGTGAVAADSPYVDVVTTPAVLSPGCPVTTQSTLVPFNLNAGPFNAQQMFMSPDSSHAWIISDLPELLGFNLTNSTPVAIPLAGGATALSGGITLDSSRIYVGGSDGTVHAIDVGTGVDLGTIPLGLKDANSNPVAPNLVTVLPH